MIDSARLRKLTAKALTKAPNKDWHRKFRLAQGPVEMDIHSYSWDGKNEVVGKATVAYYKWGEKLADDDRDFSFIGFTIAFLEVGGKVIHDMHPVIRELREDEMQNAADQLASHFCPQCRGVDTVRQRRGRSGREYVVYHYSCTNCSYQDTDVLD